MSQHSSLSVYIIPILFVFMLGPSVLPAQQQIIEKCGHSVVDSLTHAAHPAFLDRQAFEQWLEARMRVPSNFARSVITIPVVVHVVHDGEPVGIGNNISEAQVQSQIRVLNEDFRRKIGTNGFNNHPDGADIEIEFCLALVGPDSTVLAEPGIDRINRNALGFSSPPYTISYCQNTIQLATYWDPDQYMNVWTVPLADDFLGFAQLPEASTLPDLNVGILPPHKDGVVITPTAFGSVGSAEPPYNFGRTTTHEVGHWLGLIHIWGDGGCGVDDFCLDTPESSEPNYNCGTPVTRCNSIDMYENYMDYTADICMNIFTNCQKNRMRTVMANAKRRVSLLNSTVCQATGGPLANFTASQQFACEGSQIRFEDQSGSSVNSYTWSFPGGNPSSSNQKNPVVSYATPGSYNVSLTVSDGSLSSTINRNDFIQITSQGNGVIMSQNFEDGLGDWQVNNPDGRESWEIANVSGGNNGQFAVSMPFFSYSQEGEKDELLSPMLDLSNYFGLSLSFEHAYRAFTVPSGDSLIILASTDGGQTFPHVLFRDAESGSKNFATNANTPSDFIPGGNQDWCYHTSSWADCIEIDLQAFDGVNSFQLKFVARNGYGNNLYLDNISLNGGCSPSVVANSQVSASQSLKLYPNPITDRFSLSVEPQVIEVELWTQLGQRLFRKRFDAGETLTPVSLDMSSFAKGTYFLKVRGEKWEEVRKLSKL